MALSTKNVKTGEGGLPKTIQPGNTTAQIISVTLDQPAFLQQKDGYYLLLGLMEPRPSEDFEGFLIDKDNPDGPRYDGPVGRVKASTWAFQDGKTKSGIEISRDNEIMKFVKNICDELGLQDWWDAADEKYDTIEDFVEAFNNDKPFKDMEVAFCICAREYYNKDNYIAHDLFLPKFSKEGIPFELPGKEKSRLLVFDEEKHIEKAEAKEVSSFSGDGDTTDPGSDIPTGSSLPMDDFPVGNDDGTPPEFTL